VFGFAVATGLGTLLAAYPLVGLAAVPVCLALYWFFRWCRLQMEWWQMLVLLALTPAVILNYGFDNFAVGAGRFNFPVGDLLMFLALILVAVFALCARVGSTNLAAIVDATGHDPLRVASPASLLAAAALTIVVIAETGRLPVDNPATHLELTMIHEAMVLEYAGTDLALVEWASAMRLTVLLGLLASLFAPWGIAGASLTGLPLALLAFLGKVTLLGMGLGAAEVFIAKLRLFRVPELLAGSFVLALLAVASSFFLA